MSSSDEPVVRIGDSMRWSLKLAQQMIERRAREPEGIDTLTLVVVDITTDLDGHKVVAMREKN